MKIFFYLFGCIFNLIEILFCNQMFINKKILINLKKKFLQKTKSHINLVKIIKYQKFQGKKN